MNTRPRWLWWVSGSLILLVCVCIVSTLASYLFRWSITGFPNKTIWDWLQLLIIPVALAASALIFNWFKARTERQIALDKQREDLIQSYLDRMSELLLEKGLGNSKLDDEVRKVARARTISVLRQLDGGRVGDIFTFLQEAELVDRTDPIIHFKNANFTGVKWHKASLAVADLSGANLS